MASSRLSRRIVSLALLGAVVTGGQGLARAAAATPGATPVVSPVATPGDASSATWWADAVCYEVFVRSFFDGDGDGIGDLNGLTQRLDYINDGDPATTTDLGATCVWLMPIMAAASYHGYDVTNYYEVEPDYGTEDDFRRFVTEAHRRGVRVLLDLVLNHTSRDHPWFREAAADPTSPYRDWYIFAAEDPGYPGPWGAPAWHPSPARDGYYYGLFWEGMPDLNYRNPAVTAEAQRVSRFWLEEMGADGFRLDAIKHLIEDGRIQENTPATHAWLRDYRAFLDASFPDALTIGEIFDSTAATLVPYFPDQLHAYFNFDPGRQCLTAATSAGGQPVQARVLEALDRLPDQRWAPFLTNHDQPRTMTALGGDVAKAKLAATCLLTLPGLPFVYYGEEIGMTGTKPDERIRTPMQWTAEPAAGFTTGTPWQPLQDDAAAVNVAAQEQDAASLLTHYRRLVNLHTAHPALGHGALLPIETGNRSVIAFLRQSAEETVLVVLNFHRQPQAGVDLSTAPTGLPPGRYHPVALLPADAAFPHLTVGADGLLTGAHALPTLDGRTGYVLRLGAETGQT